MKLSVSSLSRLESSGFSGIDLTGERTGDFSGLLVISVFCFLRSSRTRISSPVRNRSEKMSYGSVTNGSLESNSAVTK